LHDSITTGPRAYRHPFREIYEQGTGDPARRVFGEGFLSEGLLESLQRVTTEVPEIFSTPVDDTLPHVRRLVAESVKDGYPSRRWF
jgi:hypothetical protein